MGLQFFARRRIVGIDCLEEMIIATHHAQERLSHELGIVFTGDQIARRQMLYVVAEDRMQLL